MICEFPWSKHPGLFCPTLGKTETLKSWSSRFLAGREARLAKEAGRALGPGGGKMEIDVALAGPGPEMEVGAQILWPPE